MVTTRKKALASQAPDPPKKADSPPPSKKVSKKPKQGKPAPGPDLPKKRGRSPSPVQPPPVQKPPSPVPLPAVDNEKIVKALKKGRAVVDIECSKSSDFHVYEEVARI